MSSPSVSLRDFGVSGSRSNSHQTETANSGLSERVDVIQANLTTLSTNFSELLTSVSARFQTSERSIVDIGRLISIIQTGQTNVETRISEAIQKLFDFQKASAETSKTKFDALEHQIAALTSQESSALGRVTALEARVPNGLVDRVVALEARVQPAVAAPEANESAVENTNLKAELASTKKDLISSTLEGIVFNFDQGSCDKFSCSAFKVNDLVQKIIKCLSNPDVNIVITGHCNKRSNVFKKHTTLETEERVISSRRAEKVKNAILAAYPEAEREKIKNRLTVVGNGNKNPWQDGNSSENRRVTLSLGVEEPTRAMPNNSVQVAN